MPGADAGDGLPQLRGGNVRKTKGARRNRAAHRPSTSFRSQTPACPFRPAKGARAQRAGYARGRGKGRRPDSVPSDTQPRAHTPRAYPAHIASLTSLRSCAPLSPSERGRRLAPPLSFGHFPRDRGKPGSRRPVPQTHCTKAIEPSSGNLSQVKNRNRSPTTENETQ